MGNVQQWHLGVGVSLQAAAQLNRLEEPRPDGGGTRNASPKKCHTPQLWYKRGNAFFQGCSRDCWLRHSSGPGQGCKASGAAGATAGGCSVSWPRARGCQTLVVLKFREVGKGSCDSGFMRHTTGTKYCSTCTVLGRHPSEELSPPLRSRQEFHVYTVQR